MMAESNLKYPEVFRIHGSTIISMVALNYKIMGVVKKCGMVIFQPYH